MHFTGPSPRSSRPSERHGASAYSLGITTTAEGADGITEAVNAVLQGGAEDIAMSGAIDIGAVEITVEVPVLVFGDNRLGWTRLALSPC